MANDEKADLRLKDETHARLLKEGFPHSTRVALKGRVRYVKVIVYDYASDRLGSAVVEVKWRREQGNDCRPGN